LDTRLLKAQTSNRRLRDDELMIPARLTSGKSKLRVKLRFIPDNQELFPGTPFPNQSAWSELTYQVYTMVIPKFDGLK